MELPSSVLEQYAVSLKRGSILFWKNFEFNDGSKKDKLVLLLSNCLKNKCFVVVLPTSQIQHYIAGSREMIDTIAFPKGSSSFFDIDTIIDLKSVTLVEVERLVPHLSSSVAKKLGELDETDWSKISDAVTNAQTLSPKIIRVILSD